MKFNCIDFEYLVMKYFDIRKNIIVPNVHWGIHRWKEGIPPLHECDVLVLSKSGYATEIEIKISKSDLLKDKEKEHGHQHEMIKTLYFCVPEKLVDVALKNIPERAGLLIPYQSERTKKYTLQIVKNPISNYKALKWTNEERMKLMRLGCMRIMGLKKKLSNNL